MDLELIQEKFVRTIEAIGDILTYETARRSRAKGVLDGLSRIQKLMRQFLQLKKENPTRFEKLILSQQLQRMFKQNPKEAQLQLHFDPEKHLIAFSALLNQIMRIHGVALEARNDEVSRFATYHLIWILADLTRQPGNDLFVSMVLQNIYDAAQRALERRDTSMYTSAHNWYIDIVFNRMGEGEFDHSYLETFDRYFMSSIQRTIRDSNFDTFRSLVSYISHGILIRTYISVDLWTYAHLSMSKDLKLFSEIEEKYHIDETVERLIASEELLNTADKLKGWLEEFDRLRKRIKECTPAECTAESEKLATGIVRGAKDRFLYNNLRHILFATGAYCIKRDRPTFIRYLWEFKQPSDADAIWTGESIVPEKVEELFRLYFVVIGEHRRIDFREDHSGSSVYYARYFVSLLCWLLRDSYTDREEIKKPSDYSFAGFGPRELNDAVNAAEPLRLQLQRFAGDTSLAQQLGFNLPQFEGLVEKVVVPILSDLKLRAGNQLDNLRRTLSLSPAKVEGFKSELYSSYEKHASMRNILKYYDLVASKTGEQAELEVKRSGIKQVHEKEAFFDDWFVSYFDTGRFYGESLASLENADLFRTVAGRSVETPVDSIRDIFENLDAPENYVAFTSKRSILSSIDRVGDFQPSWRTKLEKVELSGLEGWIRVKNGLVRVFSIVGGSDDDILLLLNISNLGKLVQFDPLKEESEKEYLFKHFYLRVQAFSEHSQSLTELLQKPPLWLQKKGDSEAQRNHLLGLVLIEAYQRYQLDFSSDFEGHRVNLTMLH